MNEKIVKVVPKVMSVIAVGMAVFQLATAGGVTLGTMEQRSIHVGFVLVLIYLHSASKREKVDVKWVVDILCALAASAIAVYVYLDWYAMAYRLMYPNVADLVMSVALIVLVIDAARRRVGWALPIITVVFLAYALFGHMLPGVLGHRRFDWGQLAASLTMNTEGVFGTVTGVSATYIFLFVLFGSLLEYSGAARFFVNLAAGILGHKQGGTAIAATASSGVFGMISGSAAANVVTVGAFTVPMMESTGYDKQFAGAVLASAGSGGQFMPPIMGAAAFIIAETIGVPYIQVALAAFIPAVLYYSAIIFMILLHSKRMQIQGLPKEQCPKAWPVLKNGFYLAFPLLLLLFLMAVMGWSPLRSGFWAIIASIAVSYLRRETWLTPRRLFEAFKKGAMDALTVAIICIISGIVIGTLSLTSLGLKFSAILVSLANGNMVVLLVLAAVAGVILGMGMATTSVYIVLAVLVAPALTQMGVSPLAAHLFVFYYGCLSSITPPVATASFSAAALTDSKPFALGFQAWKLSLSGYIIPFMFIFNPELLFQGSPLGVVKALVTALIGIYALSCSIEGYMKKSLVWPFRVLLFAAALLLIDSRLWTDAAGLVIVVGIYLLSRGKIHKEILADK